MFFEGAFQVQDIAEILGTPKTRIINWTQNRPIKIVASLHRAKGRGSIALFSRDDVYRFAVADKMLSAGQSGETVQQAIDELAGHLVTDKFLMVSWKLDKPGIEWASGRLNIRAIASFVLNIAEVRKEVDRAIDSYKERK